MRVRRRILVVLAVLLSIASLPSDAAAAGLSIPVPATTIYPGEVIDDGMITERSIQFRDEGTPPDIDRRARLRLDAGDERGMRLLGGHEPPSRESRRVLAVPHGPRIGLARR